MHIIDRSIAIIKPKQPYVDWANQLPDANSEASLDDLQRDCFALLIAEYDNGEEAIEHINEMWEDLFEEKLLGWSTNEDWWPKERTLGKKGYKRKCPASRRAILWSCGEAAA
jgi:hypothetical protein